MTGTAQWRAACEDGRLPLEACVGQDEGWSLQKEALDTAALAPAETQSASDSWSQLPASDFIGSGVGVE